MERLDDKKGEAMSEILIALSVVGGMAILSCILSVVYNRGWSKGYFEGRFDEWKRRNDEHNTGRD